MRLASRFWLLQPELPCAQKHLDVSTCNLHVVVRHSHQLILAKDLLNSISYGYDRSLVSETPTKPQHFLGLARQAMTTTYNSQHGFEPWKPASSCNAECHLPSSAPDKGPTTDNVDRCSRSCASAYRRASMKLQDQIRSHALSLTLPRRGQHYA